MLTIGEIFVSSSSASPNENFAPSKILTFLVPPQQYLGFPPLNLSLGGKNLYVYMHSDFNDFLWFFRAVKKPFCFFGKKKKMDEEMEDFIEQCFEEPLETDQTYEFDASSFFDFTRPESDSEIEEAQRWFEISGDYPPSRKHFIHFESFRDFFFNAWSYLNCIVILRLVLNKHQCQDF